MVGEALEKAMNLFWLKGYESASLQDLLEAMGIGRQSLYDTFGDKRSLFLAALDRYFDGFDELANQVEDPNASLENLHRLFVAKAGSLASPAPRKGCLIVNSALSAASTDEEISTRISAFIRRGEEALRVALAQALERGELEPNADPEVLARHLTCVLQGLAVLAKGGYSQGDLRQAASTAFRLAAMGGSPSELGSGLDPALSFRAEA